jgi:hypothetical protein
VHTLSEDQIAQLAPDAASLKAGRDLAHDKKWLTHTFNDRVMWGEIKGSGSSPYRTQIDLQGMAFKCSCPSRKFPCKHGLGLLLLSARSPAVFAQSDQEPDWVKEWMDKRADKGAKPAIAAEPSAAPKADKSAKERDKRQHERLLKVQGGAAELELWLKDLVRTGLVGAPEKGAVFWEKTAARMVDAQAPGLGNRVRELGEIPYAAGNGWQETLLQRVAGLYLLLEAFKNLDALPAPLQEDVRSLIGWSKSQKELLADAEAETIKDNWLVLSRQTETQDDLTIGRNWLYGAASGRYALLLNFAHKSAPISTLLAPDTVVAAALTFYPGTYPLRAAVQEQGSLRKEAMQATPLAHWEAVQAHYAAVQAGSPWTDLLPVTVAALAPARQGDQWLLRDGAGGYMPLPPDYPEGRLMQLLAYGGGHPLDMFVLRSPQHVAPAGIWLDGYYRSL